MIQPANYQGLGELVPLSPFRSDWIFVITIIPVILFIISTAWEHGSRGSLVKIVLNSRYANTAFRGAGTGRQVSSVTSWIIILLSLSTFLYFAELEFGFLFWNLRGFNLWAANFAIVLSAILLRYTISALTGEVSGNRAIFREYMFNVSASYNILGTILIAANFFIPYLSVVTPRILIYSVFLIAAVLYFLRTGRLVSIFIRGNFSLLYLILYLCALEFTPILIFVKYLSGTV